MIPVFQVTLDKSKIDAWVLKAVADFPIITKGALYTSATAVLVPAIQDKIVKNKSVYLGELHKTVRAKEVKGKVAIDVGSMTAPYGINVEFGGPPRLEKYNRILDYVKKKMGMKGAVARAQAAGIINAIAHKGTEPHPYLEPSWNATKDLFFIDFVARMKATIP